MFICVTSELTILFEIIGLRKPGGLDKSIKIEQWAAISINLEMTPQTRFAKLTNC